MRSTFILSLLFGCAVIARAQDPESVLRGSSLKCSAVKSGSYHGIFLNKPIENSDTIRGMASSVFKRSDGDSILKWKFHNQSFFQGQYRGDVLYTGDYLVRFNSRDSSGESTSGERYGSHLKEMLSGGVIYAPFDNPHGYPFPADSAYLDTTSHFEYLGTGEVGSSTCYHIRFIQRARQTIGPLTQLGKVIDYWINETDSVPIQFTILTTFLYHGDTTNEFSRQTLDTYTLNRAVDETALSLRSVPAWCKLKEYAPAKRLELLPMGETAPEWSLYSADSNSVSMAALKGHLLLIDFFYKSCLPCMEALPVIRRLEEKYKERGLKVIGFDSFDRRGKSLATFLRERNIGYPIVLDGAATDKDYHVSRYPTLYLIGKNGKIIFGQIGLGGDDEKRLEDLILQNL